MYEDRSNNFTMTKTAETCIKKNRKTANTYELK